MMGKNFSCAAVALLWSFILVCCISWTSTPFVSAEQLPETSLDQNSDDNEATWTLKVSGDPSQEGINSKTSESVSLNVTLPKYQHSSNAARIGDYGSPVDIIQLMMTGGGTTYHTHCGQTFTSSGRMEGLNGRQMLEIARDQQSWHADLPFNECSQQACGCWFLWDQIWLSNGFTLSIH